MSDPSSAFPGVRLGFDPPLIFATTTEDPTREATDTADGIRGTYRAPHQSVSAAQLNKEFDLAYAGTLYLHEATRFAPDALAWLGRWVQQPRAQPGAIVVDTLSPWRQDGPYPNREADLMHKAYVKLVLALLSCGSETQ
jgi:hypothetical protein